VLDNFDLAQLRQAVTRVRRDHPGVLLEASGGITLDRAAAVAATGVDSIAVGALTHSTRNLDIGLDVLA
jgi:nicotinate-nucleotide pyrophosphorylase (carboxylating)